MDQTNPNKDVRTECMQEHTHAHTLKCRCNDSGWITASGLDKNNCQAVSYIEVNILQIKGMSENQSVFKFII